jgi:hypothetical protein
MDVTDMDVQKTNDVAIWLFKVPKLETIWILTARNCGTFTSNPKYQILIRYISPGSSYFDVLCIFCCRVSYDAAHQHPPHFQIFIFNFHHSTTVNPLSFVRRGRRVVGAELRHLAG